MSEAIHFRSHSTHSDDSLIGLMVGTRVPRGRIVQGLALPKNPGGTEQEMKVVDLTAVPEPKPSAAESLSIAIEAMVIGIEKSFGKVANRIAQRFFITSWNLKRYSKFLVSWIKYSFILFLIYATDNRKTGAISKLLGVHLGILTGGIIAVWASELIASTVHGQPGQLLGVFAGVTLVCAITDLGKKMGAILAYSGRSLVPFQISFFR